MHFGSSFGLFLIHFGAIFKPLFDPLALFSLRFYIHFGDILTLFLAPFWSYFWTIFGSNSGSFFVPNLADFPHGFRSKFGQILDISGAQSCVSVHCP